MNGLGGAQPSERTGVTSVSRHFEAQSQLAFHRSMSRRDDRRDDRRGDRRESRREDQEDDSDTRVYVGNLPPDIRTKDIEDLFYKFGEISFVDLKTRRGPPFAFVEFSDPRYVFCCLYFNPPTILPERTLTFNSIFVEMRKMPFIRATVTIMMAINCV